ncbi:MAG TPA: hypothetical protein VK586_24645, partial [Streptosporangiaceae bacterium]|nr:hypothetical protein [Streptosporangiaceae bacterium]
EDRPPGHWRRHNQLGDYLSAVDLEQRRLQVTKAGQLLSADGTPFDTTGSGRGGDEAAFVLTGDDDGRGGFKNVRLYATTEDRIHSTLSRGALVIAVGAQQVRRGWLELISPVSGHYRPLNKSLLRGVAELRKLGVPIRNDQIELFPSPVPDGDVQLPAGYSIQVARDGIWLAGVKIARRSILWASILVDYPDQNFTVHIGTPDDEAAGRHVMTLAEARTYLDAVRRTPPQRVVLHFTGAWRANGQQWADRLGVPVVLPFLGEVTRTGTIDVRDDSGAAWRPAARALIYHPARPGRAPEPPDVLPWHETDWSLPDQLTRIPSDELPADGERDASYRFNPGGGLPEMNVEVMKSGLFARSGDPADDALRAAARGVPEQRDGWILQHAPGTSQEQLDALIEALKPAYRGRLKDQVEVVARPRPDPGITVPLPPGITPQDTTDGAWLAGGSVDGMRRWTATILPGKTLHVGLPADAAAGRPKLSSQVVKKYLRAVPAPLQPDQVVLYFLDDGQRWADELQQRVLVPAAELTADGRAVLRDKHGAEVPAMIRGLVYEPTRPGAAPMRPGLLYRAVPSWLSLDTEVAGQGIRRVPGRAGASDHFIQMTKSGPLLSAGLADAAALAAADAAEPPPGRWYLHIHHTAEPAVTGAVKAAIKRDDLYRRMAERRMDAATGAPAGPSASARRPATLRGGGRTDRAGLPWPWRRLAPGARGLRPVTAARGATARLTPAVSLYGPADPRGPVRLRGGADRAAGGRGRPGVTGPGGPSRLAGAAEQPTAPVRDQYGLAADNAALAAVHPRGLAALLGTAVEVARLPRGSRPADPAQDWVSAVQDAVTAAGGTPLAGAADQVAAQVTEDTLIKALPQVLAGKTVPLRVQAGRRQVTVPVSAGKRGTGGIGNLT